MPDREKAVLIKPEQLFTLPGAVLISVLFMAGTIGIGWANLKAQTNRIDPLEVRVSEVEKDQKKIDVMANDIGWIKKEMESQRQRSNLYRP